jgi:hypothetical protein
VSPSRALAVLSAVAHSHLLRFFCAVRNPANNPAQTVSNNMADVSDNSNEIPRLARIAHRWWPLAWRRRAELRDALGHMRARPRSAFRRQQQEQGGAKQARRLLDIWTTMPAASGLC